MAALSTSNRPNANQVSQLQKPDVTNDESSKSEYKMPTVFDVAKAGMLVPLQTLVEINGPEILSSRDEKGNTVAHWCCLGGHVTLLRYLIELKAPVDEYSTEDPYAKPIHWACVNGHIAILEILLQVGISIDSQDSKGCTPLIYASQYGQTTLAGYLIGKGAQLHICDKDGDTALHWAAFKGHSELTRLLIYSGLSPHQKDNFFQTALHLACINGNITTVQQLCELDKVTINEEDKNGKTPLMLASGRNHSSIVKYLKKAAKNQNSLFAKFDLWSLLFGPPGNTKGALMFFIVNMLFWAYPMYIFKCLPMTWNDLQVLHIVFMALNVVMWISLYHASTSDPGYLPRNIPEYDQTIREIAHYDQWRHGSVNPLSRLCHTCRTVKPLRSKHCRVCNRCIRAMDHHCPYIYNCVGHNNRQWFIVFVVSVFFCAYTTDFFAIYIMATAGAEWLTVIGLAEALFFTITATVVGGCSVYHVLYNITTNEHVNWRRYNYLQDGKGNFHNPFHRGWWNNVLEYFFIRPSLTEDEINFLNVTVV